MSDHDRVMAKFHDRLKVLTTAWGKLSTAQIEAIEAALNEAMNEEQVVFYCP